MVLPVARVSLSRASLAAAQAVEVEAAARATVARVVLVAEPLAGVVAVARETASPPVRVVLVATVTPESIPGEVTMRYAIIENGAVVNVAVAESALDANWIESETAAIGDLWDGQVFTSPQPDVAVPAEITPRQARLALLGAGLLSSVDAALDGLAEPMRSAARIEWEYATKIERASPLVAQLGPALGMSPEQIDALFVSAASL